MCNIRAGLSLFGPLDVLGDGTYSIVALSPKSKLLGIAVASGSVSVGERVPHVKPGVGVVATQAYTNIVYGTRGLELMEEGMLPKEALYNILKGDSGREFRQVAMIDVNGNKAVFTGSRVPDWSNELIGDNYIVIGNMLTGRDAVDKMAEEFETSDGDLPLRMVKALKGSRDKGGDRRGERSAALLVASMKRVELELMVNEAIDPISELSRRLQIGELRE